MIHYSKEQLTEYLEQPDSESYTDIRKHLLECSQCRHLVAEIIHAQTLLEEQAGQLSKTSTPLSEADQTLLNKYLNKEFSEAKRKEMRQRIQQDPKLLKASLHQLSHSAHMNKNQRKWAEQSQKTNRRSMDRYLSGSHESPQWFALSNLWQRLSQWQLPVWQPALAMSLMIVAVSWLNFSGSDPQIAQFDQSGQLTWTQPGTAAPGMGFFNQAGEIVTEFGPMTIKLQRKQLMFSWPAVTGASSYHIQVEQMIQGQPEIVGQASSDQSTVAITLNQVQFQQQYRWTLSGEITDDSQQPVRTFATQGQFLLVK